MKTNSYPTLVALILPACVWDHSKVTLGNVYEDTASSADDTGKPLPVDDTSSLDTALSDTGSDTGVYDSGSFDTSVYDTASVDSGSFDTSVYDTALRDTGVYDTGSVTPSVSDSGVFDTGVYDSASLDSSSFDTGYSPERWCASSTVPESVPFITLLPQHYALVDSDDYFETNTGSRSKPVIEDSVYTLNDTYGCSCERILDCKPSTALTGEYQYGCTEGTMKDWVNQRGWAAYCE